MIRGRLPDVSFGACVRVMNEIEEMDEGAKIMSLRDMRMSLADKLIKAKVTEVKGQFHTEYSIQIYVLTADELAEIIHEKVREIQDCQPLRFSNEIL